ncbi:hypothetical protein XENOCAPTIV_002618 [Xenoophorus captivus]|uniref:Sushi domain-containing protein n=1 Tax=Xenoophorus captivus TaxID=1517983 RepID=A0ABV0RBP5_9TELE
MVCSAQGVWVPPDGMEAPRCIANFCLRPPEVPHAILDSVNKPKYASNTEVSYKCEEGFMLNTTAMLRCLLGGKWEPSPFEIGCVPVRCSKPESIDRGYMRGTNYSFGAVVAYSCETGYLIRGEKRRICKANGEWGGLLPACVRTRYTFNNKVRYACNAGYKLVGGPERICQANRQWSNNNPPTCVLLTCDPPPDVVHGYYKGSAFRVGSKVEYFCDEGYELGRNAVWTCLKNGEWDQPSPPRCSPVKCPEPPLEESHLVLKSLDSESGTVELSCDDGFVLEGANVLRCTASQEWNDTFPVCKEVFCGPPPEVSFGVPSNPYPPFPFSSAVTYTCMGGFNFRKEHSVSCLATSQWSTPYPECIPVECPQPVEISNGIVDVQGLMYLSKALYSCKTGYNLVGNSTVLCGESGAWIGVVPSCRPVECSTPRQIARGKVVYTKLQYGHSATYSCHRGFQLHGPETLKCLADGEWDSEPPVCVQISCTLPQPIENGFVEGQDHSFGVTIFYSCFPGFQLVGQDHLTCEESGWSSSVPMCVPSDCGLPPHIDFGDYVRVMDLTAAPKDTIPASSLDLNFLHGTLIEYRCHPGYNISRRTRLVCQDDGGWNGTAPSCISAECETPSNPEHGFVNVTTSPIGSVASYACEEGYELVGEPVRRCVSGQLWTSDAPVCRPVSCGDPGVVANCTTHGREFVYPEVLNFECYPGFVLKGTDTIACQADGKWNGQKPRCEPLSCGPPTVPSDITVQGKEYTYNKEVELRCQPGFIVKGTSRSVCQADGTWSHGYLSCVPAHCGKPSPIPHGHVIGSEFGYNSKVKYECDEGFKLNGEPTLVCQSDGLWHKPPPRCDIVSCDPPEDISHGFVNGSGFNYNNVVEYVCFEGYEVVGDPILRCSAQGLWVGSVPQCQPCACSPPEVRFGMVTGTGQACGDRVQFSCDQGYKLLGPSQAVCDKGGVWSPGVPVCGRGRCSVAPPEAPNAVLQGGIATFPETVTYKCRLGYLLKGSPVLSCGRDGRWGEPRIHCEPVSCGKPPCLPAPCPLPNNISIPHLRISGRELTPVGATITLSCPTGFYLQGSALAECQGDSVQTCQGDGTWSGTQPVCVGKYVCKKKRDISKEVRGCDGPKQVLHGRVQEHNLSSGRALEFQCDRGYNLVGDGLVMCMGGNTWSSTFPICQGVSCGPPLHVTNGLVRGAVFQFGDVAVYSCFSGYTMEGVGRSRCQENGTWTPPPTCRGRQKSEGTLPI